MGTSKLGHRRHHSNNTEKNPITYIMYFIGIGDGSFKDGYASRGWIIADSTTSTTLTTGAAPVDGPKQFMGPDRAEAMAILAVLTIINIIKQVSHTVGANIEIYTDYKTIIDRVQVPILTSTSYTLSDNINVFLQIKKNDAPIKK